MGTAHAAKLRALVMGVSRGALKPGHLLLPRKSGGKETYVCVITGDLIVNRIYGTHKNLPGYIFRFFHYYGGP